MPSVVQTYDVEWEDRDGEEHVLVVRARDASEAWEKGLAALRNRPDFGVVLNAELFP